MALEEELEIEAIEASRLQLERGDLLVFYTDGITEARNLQGEMFGPDRLCSIATENRTQPVLGITRAVISAASQWGSVQEDDFTVLVVRHVGVKHPAKPGVRS